MEGVRGDDSSPAIDRCRIGMRAVDEIRQREYDKLCVSVKRNGRGTLTRCLSVSLYVCLFVRGEFIAQPRNAAEPG